MDKMLSATQFKAKCLRIVGAVAASGDPVVITKNGKPIARLVPIKRPDPDRRRIAIDKLKEFAKGRTLGVPIKQLINEGRP